MLTTAPRGTKDILPGAVNGWRYVESVLRDVCREFNYQEIRTPIFEHTELFQRGIGDGTDVVDKEMYTFNDRSGRSITLRPENTAAVVRSFVENKLYAEPMPLKVFYIGPMLRTVTAPRLRSSSPKMRAKRAPVRSACFIWAFMLRPIWFMSQE